MQDIDTILSIWALILGIFGGIAMILFVDSWERKDTGRSVALTAGIILLILAPFLSILLIRDVFRDVTIFYVFIGILFGLIIALILYLMYGYVRAIRELPEGGRWSIRNRPVLKLGLAFIDLVAMAAWLGWFFRLAL